MAEHLISLLEQYRYAIIIPATLVEGPLVMMISGFIIKLGYLSFFPTYICLMIGDTIADIIWYVIGYFYGDSFVKKFGKYFSVTEEKVAAVKKLFHKHHDYILPISKITMGFGFAVVTLLVAGIAKVPFRRYLFLNLIGQFFWTGALMAVGYFFGQLYVTIDNVLGRITIIGLFIIFFFALIGFGKYMKTRSNNLYLS